MCRDAFPRLPAGEFRGEFGEKVAGSTAPGLRQRRGIVGESRGGRRAVVRGRAAVSQLAAVESAAAGRASGEAETVGRSGVGDAVGGRHRVPLTAGRHGNVAVLFPVRNDGEAVCVVSVTADIRVPPGHTRRRSVIAWGSGGSFPAVRDVSLVGVVGVAHQRAGGWCPAGSWDARFTELDSTFLFHAVLRSSCLTPLWMSHPWREVLTNLLAVTSLFVVGGDAPLDFEVGGRLAVELTAWPRFGQRQVAAGGRVAGLQLRGLPAQEQVGGCDLVILHLGQRVLDFLQVVAHPNHHIYSLLICDVQLWFSVRFELVIIKSCIDPSILHNLLESTPLGRVEHQETFEEVLAVCGHVERDAVLPSEHTLPQLLKILSVKGQRAADQRVQYHPQTPNVHLWPVVLLSLEKLWCCVRRRAAKRIQLVAQSELVAEAEICNLDIHVCVEEQVLSLEVSVNNVLLVAVLHR